MSEAHHRKKNPQQVRMDLLEGTAELAAQGGLAAVSVQSVSAAAGVTKGAFFHHFLNKQALLDEVFTWMLGHLDQRLDELIAADKQPYGCFTRAFVNTVFLHESSSAARKQAGLWIATLTDTELRGKWVAWYDGRLARHAETDGGPVLECVRLTVDGIWLAGLSGVAIRHPDEIHARLLALTYPTNA
ncbi:TetR/AcrR family transcriptional regulator [Massilia rubra]|uniref:TetR/AcrR family transcriptional regulator n=1 Tax=Massilia rubra TaxID=2607910 RepID=A0ABX0LRN1_9BURK|nr:TetR/AcrR family transcriptional regulator [Massilia rubra]NHZ35373.1 TetR/AcrR family transcriptional regulator [Massilia rubra]